LFWNIRHGGGKRSQQIAAAIAGHRPDLVVLAEYRANGTAKALREALHRSGLSYLYSSVTVPNVNGLLVVTRTRCAVIGEPPAPPGHHHRLVHFRLGDVHVLACYFPQRGEKIPVFEAVLDWAEAHLSTPALIVGDLNTGKHGVDEAGATFIAADYLERLEEVGFTDAWRHFRGPAREYSWFSTKGNGFRVDHAFVSEALLRRLRRVDYSHAEREEGISDHAILIIDAAPAGSIACLPALRPRGRHSDARAYLTIETSALLGR
jgi:exonuclease III